jgi:cellulose biosynthesis protein BcsQ
MIISITNGKGGTGKTTIAVNSALSLPKGTVQLIDCDVEEPNFHLFLFLHHPPGDLHGNSGPPLRTQSSRGTGSKEDGYGLPLQ